MYGLNGINLLDHMFSQSFGFDLKMLPRSRPGEAPPRSYFRRSREYTPNGKREVARRLRQIQNRQLQVTA